VGSTYVLPAEGEVQKKILALKTLSGQLAAAARHQAATEQQSENDQAMARDLLRQRVALGQQLSAIEQQIRNMGGPTPDMVARRNEVVLAYNGIGDQIRLLQSGQGADPDSRDKLAAEVSRRREGFIQAVLDLRQLVDATTKAYAGIVDDPEVKRAIDELGRSSKTKPRLGPSSQFATNVKTLERIERSVMTDAVDVRKQGGVFWVDATFNGKVVRPMVFDTGAGLTTIPSGLADEIGLKPSPSDPVVRCETADGTVVEARRMTIPTLRIGRFTVNDVDCAVMPSGKGNTAPLLGQSFRRHFTYKFTPESGHLMLSRVEGLEPSTQPARSSRAPARSKSRGGRSRGASTKAATETGGAGIVPD
jgi:aspartyl protease family protein